MKQHRLVTTTVSVVGLALLLAACALLWQHFTAPPVYQYVIGETVPAAEAGPLAAYVEAGLTVRRASLQSAEQASSRATLDIAETAAGPVLLNWQARVDDPFMTLAVPPQDVVALSGVLKRHVSEQSKVFAWWDTSRQINALGAVDFMFDRHLGLPLFLPAHWSGQRAKIEKIENGFWTNGASDATNERERFRQFARALTAPEAEGMAMLRSLAGEGKPTILVLHLRDIILLGQMFPDRLGVAFQDFGASNDVHGMVRRVHAWLEEHKYAAYGVLQASGQPVRAIALTDAASAKTLAARLLPFMGNEQHDVSGATLVYQAGGFSVFEIAPADNTKLAISQPRS